jgi:outer membrane receptor protein involved in Fe transport
VGPRTTRNRTQAYQVIGGIRGDLPMLDGWEYDLSFQHARTELSRIFENDVSKSRIQDVLDSTSASANPGAVDGGPCSASAPATCVVGNLFGDGNLNSDAASYMALQINEEVYTTQDVILVSTNGDLGETIHVPGADPIGVAFGFEWRRTKSESFPDDCYSTPDCSPGFGSTTSVRASQYVKEVFGEVLIPILSDLPFARSLSFEGGYRWADYDTVGSVSAYKVGGEWSPIEDLRLRVLYQHAVRAPNIFENYQPITPGLDNSGGDPCAAFAEATGNTTVDQFTRDLCVATGVSPAFYVPTGNPGEYTTFVSDVISGQINAISSGNLNLTEEDSKTLTVGGVYQPGWLEGLTIQIDWYRVEIDDAISNFDADVILTQCYDPGANPSGDPNNLFCQFVSRNPATGALIGNPLYGVLEPEFNIATLETSGVDFSVDYDLDLGWGRVDIGFLGTKLIKRDDQPSELAPVNVCKGIYGPICNSPNSSLTFQQRTTLYVGDFFGGYRWRYINGSDFEDPANATSATGSISDTHYVELVFGWEPRDIAYLEGFRFQVAVDNLFDEDPPIVGQDAGPTDQNSGNTFPGSYDAVGRAVTFSVSKKF